MARTRANSRVGKPRGLHTQHSTGKGASRGSTPRLAASPLTLTPHAYAMLPGFDCQCQETTAGHNQDCRHRIVQIVAVEADIKSESYGWKEVFCLTQDGRILRFSELQYHKDYLHPGKAWTEYPVP